MDLPPVGHTPTQSDLDALVLARTIFHVRGILFRASVQLEGTPKPWPDRTRKVRALVAQAKGMLHDAFEALPPQYRTAATTTDPVARNTTRNTHSRL